MGTAWIARLLYCIFALAGIQPSTTAFTSAAAATTDAAPAAAHVQPGAAAAAATAAAALQPAPALRGSGRGLLRALQALPVLPVVRGWCTARGTPDANARAGAGAPQHYPPSTAAAGAAPDDGDGGGSVPASVTAAALGSRAGIPATRMHSCQLFFLPFGLALQPGGGSGSHTGRQPGSGDSFAGPAAGGPVAAAAEGRPAPHEAGSSAPGMHEQGLLHALRASGLQLELCAGGAQRGAVMRGIQGGGHAEAGGGRQGEGDGQDRHRAEEGTGGLKEEDKEQEEGVEEWGGVAGSLAFLDPGLLVAAADEEQRAVLVAGLQVHGCAACVVCAEGAACLV